MKNGLPKLPADASKALPEEARAWLDAHPELSKDEMELAWAWAGQAKEEVLEIDSDRIEKMRAKIAADRHTSKPLNWRRNFLSMAASILILCGIGFAFWYQSETVHSSSVGELLEVALPDGSKLLLNASSTVRYAAFDEKERRVELRGEAYFDIVEDSVPFIVETFNSETEVLGTRFTVRAWESDLSPETMVVLESGKVSLSSDNSVLLAPGQMSRVINGFATEPSSIKLEQWLNWKNGGMAYENQNVGSILNELQRRFGLEFEAPSTLRSTPISIFQNSVETPVSVLESICGAMSCRYTTTEDGYQLK